MALPQDGQNANALATVKEVPIGKKLIFVDPDTNEGGIITLEDLTTQILKKLTSQTFALDQGTKTLPAALNELNSKAKILTPNISGKSSFYDLQAGIYYFNTEDYRNFTDRPGGSSGRAIWIYNHTGGDERIGILLCALGGKTMVGQCYGGTSLTWKEL